MVTEGMDEPAKAASDRQGREGEPGPGPARALASSPAVAAPSSPPAARTGSAAARPRQMRLLAALSLFGIAFLTAVGGWGMAAYLYFVQLPAAVNLQKVTYSLDLVDRFNDSPAHQAYMRLGDEMKPWWEQIDDLQRQIAAAPNEDARLVMIAHRDEMLLAFIKEHKLGDDIDTLVAYFDVFDRCLAISACDEEALRKSIAVDIKRIFRTFRPYIQSVRESHKPGTEDYGRDLEDLFFRFVG